ncbi:helix-turn-helix domain-containing protein [Actinoplanes sp. NPDC049265]|uniref:helix-turn-helix domain-containing protein n=1 Tax=Actinoplanes sp. NPDC049265 TaxID=3363902 RepID=UPI00370FB867
MADPSEVSRLSDDPGPMVRRRQLGSALRRYREAAGLTVTDVARRLSVAASTVSRLENAQRKASIGDVRYLCEIYQVGPAVRDELMELAQSSRRRGWWEDSSIPPGMQKLIGLEGAAELVKIFHPLAIPGICQTEAYATAVTTTFHPENPDYVRRTVATRMRRQQILRRDASPRIEIVLDEAVLHRIVGGGEVMSGQIARLAALAREPRVSIRIIPFSAGAHSGMNGGFTILEFTAEAAVDSPSSLTSTVYIEALYEYAFRESEEELKGYQDAFDALSQRALDQQLSIEFMDELASAHPVGE